MVLQNKCLHCASISTGFIAHGVAEQLSTRRPINPLEVEVSICNVRISDVGASGFGKGSLVTVAAKLGGSASCEKQLVVQLKCST